MPLSPGVYLDHLRRNGAALLEVARSADLAGGVPSCPEWSLRQLMAHTGAVHRRTTALLEQRLQEPPAPAEAVSAPPADGMAGWLEEGLSGLCRQLELTGPEAEVWNWARPRQRSSFWFRRMAHETTVHRWDAQAATGSPGPVDPDLAADGIGELLEVLLPARWRPGPHGPEGSLHVHVTGADGEWTVAPGAAGPEVTIGHSRADAAVRGDASEVLLFLWGRPVPGAQTLGSEAVLEAWRSKLRF